MGEEEEGYGEQVRRLTTVDTSMYVALVGCGLGERAMVRSAPWSWECQ